jgi:hypothetical protein
VSKKSRRGKHLTRNKRMERRQDSLATPAPQPATIQKPVSPVPTPAAKVLRPTSKLAQIQHPYITTELRRIAILAGIMVVVLVVLYFAIP